MPKNDKKRLHVYWSGRVQGVGFRYTAEQVALDLGSTDEQAAVLLAARAEAAYARKNAEKHMLYALNYTPWL